VHDALLPSGTIGARLPGGGRVLFTTRERGNLSTAAGDDCERGSERREQLARELGLRRLCASRQVHGTYVNTVTLIDREGEAALDLDADGHVTALAGVGVAVLGADCMLVAIGCQAAVGMIHAGWRGLATGVLEEGARAVRELGGDQPLGAVVGPCAGSCCYEVGPEVHEALGEPPRRGPIDLRAIAHRRLMAAGVADIQDVDACTICDERFFSHRREQAQAGRQAGIAWLS
jgi:YfiH family protein